MNYRLLGRTGLRVSEIGFGTWGIGKSAWVGADDNESIRALQAAHELGINFFDTALLYGEGHSERLLARAFGNTPAVIIASKVPPKGRPSPGRRFAEVYPSAYILGCLETTLTNLGRDTIDLYQFHNWSEEWAAEPAWQETIAAIRRSGKAKWIGISTNHHQPDSVLPALKAGLIDVVQVIYNIFDQSPEDKLLPYCGKNRIGVIARVPFDEGGLTGKIGPESTFPADDFRNWYFAGDRKQQVQERTKRLINDCGIAASELPSLALRFCLSHSAVSTVIPGMRIAQHVHENVNAASQGSLDQNLLQRMPAHRWERNFYLTSLSEKLAIFYAAPFSAKWSTLMRKLKRS